MTRSPENTEEMRTGENTLYRETIPFGNVYHGVMCAVIFLLAVGFVFFVLTRLYPGIIALGFTIPFVGWVYLGCRKTELVVTHERFEVRYWFMRFSVQLDDVISVRVRDKITLPYPYKGHIKVGYGWHSWRDLKVMVCRRGLPVVEMSTADGVTVIVTPLHAHKLAEVLCQRIDQGRNTQGTEQSAAAYALPRAAEG